MNCKWNGMVKG